MRRSHESGPKAPGRLKNMVAGATLVLGGAAALGACSYGESSAPAPAEQTTTTGMARGLNTSDTLATVDSLSALENESALKIQEADMKAGKITNADPYLDTSPEKASRDYDGDGKIESPFREGSGMENESALKIQEADMKAGKITNADPYLDTSPEKASRDYDGDGKIESPFREGSGMENESALKIQEADMKAGKITNADPYLDTSPEKASRDYDGDGKIESPFREGDGMEDVSEAMQVNKGHIETDENGNKTYVLVGADDGTKHRLPLNSAAAEDVENGIQG